MRHARAYVVVLLASAWLVACTPGTPGRDVRVGIDPVSWSQGDWPPTLAEAGWEHVAAERYGSAVAVFRRQLALAPDSVQAHYGLAIAYAGIGRVDLSDEHASIAERLDADPVRRFNNLAYVARVRGDDATASALLERARVLQPQNEVLAANVAWRRFGTGNQ